MDAGAVISLVSAGITGVSAIGLAVYALVLRNRTASAENGRSVAIDKMRLAESLELAAVTRLVVAEQAIKRLTTALNAARADVQESHGTHAENGDPGGGVAVDDALRRLHPDADGDALRAGRAAGGAVPSDGAGPAADADEDDLLERGR